MLFLFFLAIFIFIIAHLPLFHHFLYLVMWFRRFLKSYFHFFNIHHFFISLFFISIFSLSLTFVTDKAESDIDCEKIFLLPSFNISFYLSPSFIISFFFIILFTSPTHFRFILFFFFLSVSNFQSSRHSYLVQLFLLNLID